MGLMLNRRREMRGGGIPIMVLPAHCKISIDDLIPSDDGWVFEMRVGFIKLTRYYYTYAFGAFLNNDVKITTNSWLFREQYSSSKGTQVFCNSTNSLSIPKISLVDGIFYNIKMESNGIVIDGTSYTFSERIQSGVVTTPFRFGGDSLYQALQYFKAYHNGVLLYDLIPKIDSVSGKLGFYNKKTGVYYLSNSNVQPIWYDDYLAQNQ